MQLRGIAKVLVGVYAALVACSVPIINAKAQTVHKNEDSVNDIAVDRSIDLSLKLISSHSWKGSDIKSITFNYDNHIDNIIIKGSGNDSIKFDEYNSVDDTLYAANIIVEDGHLIITQSADKPKGGHDLEARLFIPEDYSGPIKIVNKGNLKVSDLSGTAAFDVRNDAGVVSFFSVCAKGIKINSPDSISGILIMRDVKSFVDISVIGRITINGNSCSNGTIKGSDGTYCSTITANFTDLNGDLVIQNQYGPTVIGFASDAAFKIDVEALNISSTYPGDNFQITRTTLKGSNGVKPEYNLTCKAGTFTLNAWDYPCWQMQKNIMTKAPRGRQ